MRARQCRREGDSPKYPRVNGRREFREVCEFREFNEFSENLLPNLPKFLNLPKKNNGIIYLRLIAKNRFSRICFRHSEEGSARRESLVAEKVTKQMLRMTLQA